MAQNSYCIIISEEIAQMFHEEIEPLFQAESQEILTKEGVCPTLTIRSSPSNSSNSSNSVNIGIHSSFKRLIDSPKSLSDVSLQDEIFRGNAELLRTAVIGYLEICLGYKFYEIRTFLPEVIINANQSKGQIEDQSILDLITSIKLLNNESQQEINNPIYQFPQILQLFRQLKLLLGKALTQEFALILAKLLDLKVAGFKNLKDVETLDLIPQMERFWGDQGNQKFISNGWEIFEEVDYYSIKKFSVQKVEEMASVLYYTFELEYLTRSKSSISNDEVCSKFCALVCLFSQTLFLTMSGIRQQKQDLSEFLQELKLDMSSGEVQSEQPLKRIKLQ